MRKLVIAAGTLFLFASAAMAETKLATSWKCSKPAKENKLEVGDEADHTYSIGQGMCTSTKGTIEGVREKTGADTQFVEKKGTSSSWHGRFIVTMENGDRIFYNYEGSGPNDIAQPAGNKWTMDGGTGKYKGIEGLGSCIGKRSEDGSSTWECTGTYKLGS